MTLVITLLTDFGISDSYVAEMKAVLISAIPTVQLVDVSHDVSPGDIHAAQYLLGRSWRPFPAGTVHLVVVDPGVGTGRRALAVERDSHFFVGPDNGVLTPILDRATVVALPPDPGASRTFHGRDIFAPAAARLAQGTPVTSLGLPIVHPLRITIPEPSQNGKTVAGVVIYVDRFGTLVTNIPAAWARPSQKVHVGGVVVPLLQTFGDVATGALVAFSGSDRTIEIAVRDGSAAERLKGKVGTQVRVAEV
jgi:S-adenosylmethionine hydrolase